MKSLLILTLMTVAACGRVELPEGSSIGEMQKIQPEMVNATELASIGSICQSLIKKNPQSLINANYTFSYARKDCSDAEFPISTDVTVTLSSTSEGYKFTTGLGINFAFADVETPEKGSMKIICDKLTGIVASPISANNQYTFFTTQGISSKDCAPSNQDEVCIQISQGSAEGGDFARITRKEFIRFDVAATRGRQGFFTQRKIITETGCQPGSTSGQLAILK